jgi:predicted DNA-binding transcriptional regulator YafY
MTEDWMLSKGAEEKVRVNRVLIIDEAIRLGAYPSIEELARKAEITKRTIERDIEYLRDKYQAPIEVALRRIFAKIAKSMPEKVTVDTRLLSPQISVISEHQGYIDPKLFENIFTALKTRRTITFGYRPLQKTTYMGRTVNPYHAICQRGNWYFIGHCHDQNEPGMFSFSRVKSITLTNKHIWDVTSRQGSAGELVILFTEECNKAWGPANSSLPM